LEREADFNQIGGHKKGFKLIKRGEQGRGWQGRRDESSVKRSSGEGHNAGVVKTPPSAGPRRQT